MKYLPTAGKGTNFCMRSFIAGLKPLDFFIRKLRPTCNNIKQTWPIQRLAMTTGAPDSYD